MTSAAEGLVVEEDSFNSTSYFDNLKLNNSTCNKSWVELMEEEEELEEEYARGPWRSPKAEPTPPPALAGAENVGTAEVPAVVDRRPASSVIEQAPPSPVLVKEEVESDVEYEEAGEAATAKCDAQVKYEQSEAKVKTEEEAPETVPLQSTYTDEKDCKDELPPHQDTDSKATLARRHHGQSAGGDDRREQEPRCSRSGHSERGDGRPPARDQNPAELLFNFDSARKRRHPRKTSSDGGEGSRRGTRNWDEVDTAKKQRRHGPYRRDSSSSSSQGSLDKKKEARKPVEYEKDPVVLARRQKQIDYGKNTVGYDNYLQQVPKQNRTRQHPKTPPKYMKYSRRAWDGMVRIWRQQLHLWDDPSDNKSDDFANALKDKDDKAEDWECSSGDEEKKDVASSLTGSVGSVEPSDALDMDT